METNREIQELHKCSIRVREQIKAYEAFLPSFLKGVISQDTLSLFFERQYWRDKYFAHIDKYENAKS